LSKKAKVARRIRTLRVGICIYRDETNGYYLGRFHGKTIRCKHDESLRFRLAERELDSEEAKKEIRKYRPHFFLVLGRDLMSGEKRYHASLYQIRLLKSAFGRADRVYFGSAAVGGVFRNWGCHWTQKRPAHAKEVRKAMMRMLGKMTEESMERWLESIGA